MYNVPDKIQNTSIKRNSCHNMVTRSEGLQQGMGGSHARAEHQAVAGGLQTGQSLLEVTPAGVAIPTIHWLTLYLLSCYKQFWWPQGFSTGCR